MTIVFLVEEQSMKVFLDIILPRVLPSGVDFITVPHEGKSDLRKSVPIKLSSWNVPDTKFMIIQDQDSNDCHALKEDLLSLADKHDKEVVVRIACHELEAWYFGDLQAVSKAYGKDLSGLAIKRKYRNPDSIISPKHELKGFIPELEQISGAKKIAPFIDVSHNTSTSFNAFLAGIKKLIG